MGRGRPPGNAGPAPILTPEQIRLLLKFLKVRGRHSLRAEVAISLSLYLGLRAKEIASLTWDDVFDDAGRVRDVLYLARGYTKSSRPRSVFLSARRLRELLVRFSEGNPTARLSGTPLLRSQKGGPLTSSSMARFLKQLFVEAGIPDASSHSGRRTFITTLAERGVDLKAISVLAGHANIRTTAMYVENNPIRLARILQDVSW